MTPTEGEKLSVAGAHAAKGMIHRAAAWLLGVALALAGAGGLPHIPQLPNAATLAFADADICTAHAAAVPTQPGSGQQSHECCFQCCCPATAAIVPPEAGIAAPALLVSAASVPAARQSPPAHATSPAHRPRAPPLSA